MNRVLRSFVGSALSLCLVGSMALAAPSTKTAPITTGDFCGESREGNGSESARRPQRGRGRQGAGQAGNQRPRVPSARRSPKGSS